MTLQALELCMLLTILYIIVAMVLIAAQSGPWYLTTMLLMTTLIITVQTVPCLETIISPGLMVKLMPRCQVLIHKMEWMLYLLMKQEMISVWPPMIPEPKIMALIFPEIVIFPSLMTLMTTAGLRALAGI